MSSPKIVIQNVRVTAAFVVPEVNKLVAQICFARTGDMEVNKLVDGRHVAKHPKDVDKALQDADWKLRLSHRTTLEFDVDIDGNICNLRVAK